MALLTPLAVSNKLRSVRLPFCTYVFFQTGQRGLGDKTKIAFFRAGFDRSTWRQEMT